MRNREAAQTHNRNQMRGALRKYHAEKKIKQGMKPGDASSGRSVAYCSACGAPAVDSPAGRARHAQRGAKCALAMAELESKAKPAKPSADLQ